MASPQKNAHYHYQRWKIMAPSGLVLIGAGACLIAEGAALKYGGGSLWEWVLFGTLALVVFNAGISVFGGAVVHRTHYERLREGY